MYKELRFVLLVLHITSHPRTKGYLIRQTYIQLCEVEGGGGGE